jgi:Ca2+-binding RTX toxin-like protein
MAIPGLDNTVLGTSGNDNVKGTKANDSVRGLAGNDKVNGKKGDDFVTGDSGNDRLKGGQGDDWVIGGEGDDIYTGGKGADQFRVDARTTSEPDRDFIRDLNFGEGDLLVLSEFAPGTFEDEPGNDLVIVGGGTGAIIDSLSDIVELVELSDAVVAKKGSGNNLVLEIDTGSGLQTVVLKGFYHDYVAAGGDIII